MIATLLAAAPALFNAGRAIYNAVAGDDAETVQTPQDLEGAVDRLPPAKREAVIKQIVALQNLDTDRFLELTDGDAEKVRATARPEIARRAMDVVSIFSKGITWLFIATIVEWLLRLACAALGKTFPPVSLWGLIADAEPVKEMIWGPLLASFWACVAIIKKYMGCRERDKAQQFEMQAGRSLKSTEATIAAAGGAISSLIRAIKS